MEFPGNINDLSIKQIKRKLLIAKNKIVRNESVSFGSKSYTDFSLLFKAVKAQIGSRILLDGKDIF